MAFRRGFRSTFRKRGFRRSRPVARKRYTWVTALQTACGVQNVPWLVSESCNTPFQLILLDNQVLQDKFSDRATVVRSVGRLSFFVAQTFVPDVLTNFTNASNFAWRGVVELGVHETSAATPNGLTYSPAVVDTDFSEGRWLKTWTKHVWPRNAIDARVSVTGGNFGVCSKPSAKFVDCTTGLVEQCITREQLTDGSGYTWDYTVPGGIKFKWETDCVPVGFSQDNLVQDATDVARPVNEWQLSMNWKKRIPLRENQQLSLWCDFADMSGLQSPISQINYMADIKLLIQLG